MNGSTHNSNGKNKEVNESYMEDGKRLLRNFVSQSPPLANEVMRSIIEGPVDLWSS